MLPTVIILVVVIAGIFAPLIAPHAPDVPSLDQLRAPPFWYPEGSVSYFFGGDELGRDILTRLIYGARVSLVVSGIAIFFAGAVGGTLGMLAGFLGGRTDTVIMRAVDTMLAMPYMLLALVIAAILGASLGNVIFVIALVQWASYARIIRGEVLSIKARDFVALARVAGASPLWIVVRHIFPNVVNTLIVLATLQAGTVILFEAVLSFLGMGVPPPTPSWGSMVAGGRKYLSTAWWISTIPGFTIMFAVLGINLMGDWLRDHLDPLRRQI